MKAKDEQKIHDMFSEMISFAFSSHLKTDHGSIHSMSERLYRIESRQQDGREDLNTLRNKLSALMEHLGLVFEKLEPPKLPAFIVKKRSK